MNSILKIGILILAFSVLVSCDVFKEPDFCSENYHNPSFSGIKFDDYYRTDYMYFNPNFDDNKYFTHYNDSIPFSEKFSFSETGDFSHLKIAYQNDTIMKLNGKFKIHKDGGYSWSVLELSADSIYEKKVVNDTIKDSIYFSSNFTASKYSGLSDNTASNYSGRSDNLIADSGNWVSSDSSNVWETNSNCFELNIKQFSDSEPCNSGTFLMPYRTYCLQQPEELENE